jgi:hypothetical protein
VIPGLTGNEVPAVDTVEPTPPIDEHPRWCDRTRCIPGAGFHESNPITVNVAGRGHPPQVLVLLRAPAAGAPVKVRLTTVGDMAVHEVGLDLDAARGLATALGRLLRLTDPPSPPAADGYPIGGRG